MARATFTTNSPFETRRLGAAVARAVAGGTFIGLSGPLGAGKSEFARGFASELGVIEELVSPTFVLEAVYAIPKFRVAESGEEVKINTLHHWDLYRLGQQSSVEEIEEYRGNLSKLVLIEWPEKVPVILRLIDVRIELALLEGVDSRRILIECNDAEVFRRFQESLQELS